MFVKTIFDASRNAASTVGSAIASAVSGAGQLAEKGVSRVTELVAQEGIEMVAADAALTGGAVVAAVFGAKKAANYFNKTKYLNGELTEINRTFNGIDRRKLFGNGETFAPVLKAAKSREITASAVRCVAWLAFSLASSTLAAANFYNTWMK